MKSILRLSKIDSGGARRGSFRVSQACSESGVYRADLSGYTPFRPTGDPELADRLPVKTARKVCDALIEAANINRANLSAFLRTQGFSGAFEPTDWEAMEPWLRQIAETSQEPVRKGEPKGLRPRYAALLAELSVALGDAVAQRVPGARLSCAADRSGYGGKAASPYPIVTVAGRDYVCAPRGMLGTIAGCGITGKDSSMMSYFWNELARTATTTPEAELDDWIEQFHEDEGRLPTVAELTALIIDAGLEFDEIPQSVLDRLPG